MDGNHVIQRIINIITCPCHQLSSPLLTSTCVGGGDGMGVAQETSVNYNHYTPSRKMGFILERQVNLQLCVFCQIYYDQRTKNIEAMLAVSIHFSFNLHSLIYLWPGWLDGHYRLDIPFHLFITIIYQHRVHIYNNYSIEVACIIVYMPV